MQRLLTVIGCILTVLIVCMLLSVSGLKRLTAFEQALPAANLSADEDNSQLLRENLDKVEAFIRDNRFSLGIFAYERTPNHISVKFCAGLAHIYHPIDGRLDSR